MSMYIAIPLSSVKSTDDTGQAGYEFEVEIKAPVREQEPYTPAAEIFCALLAMGFAASIAGFYLSKLS